MTDRQKLKERLDQAMERSWKIAQRRGDQAKAIGALTTAIIPDIEKKLAHRVRR